MCLFLPACEQGLTGQGYSRDLAPVLERLVKTYAEDLVTRRFEIIAVFERPAEQALFHMEPPAPAGTVAISTDRARPDTGAGSLRMALTSPAQRVVCAETPGSEWALPRDWSRFHLLLLSVYSPRKLGGFLFTVRAGDELELVYHHPRGLLEQGWNLLRVDLADLEEQIDLANVRELRFGCDPLDTPVDLYLDDMILVDNARDVFATAEREPGDLYVRARGRRIAVGAVDQFELVFARGQIRQWFDLASDPGRVHNLVGPGSLGPLPVVMPADGTGEIHLDEHAQWSPLGMAVQTYQSFVEANALCATIQGRWEFIPPGGSVTADAPSHEWRYTVCHDGRVFIECTGTARTGEFQPAAIGIAFCCDGDFGFQRELVQGESAGDRPARPSYLLFSRPGAGQADLLVVPAAACGGRTAHSPAWRSGWPPAAACGGRTLDNPLDPRLAGVWTLPEQGDRFVFAAMLRVRPPDMDSIEQARPFAADYAARPPIAFGTGQLVRTDPGDFDNDGFSEGRGYDLIQLDGTTARFTIDGHEHMRFSPLFKLIDVADRDVWIYRDGKLLPEIHRDTNGDVLFEITGVVTRDVLVEMTSRQRGADAE